MNKNTQKITYGAAIIAIFAIMLLFNRQTGRFFEEMFMFLFPIPMVAFSARYGWKNSLPVLVGMGFFAFLFGTFTTIFYAVSEALIGMVMGNCIHRKTDSTKTLFAVMLLSAVVNVLNTIVLADLFGMDLGAEIAEMQTMMTDIFSKTNLQLPDNMLGTDFLKRIMVISMVLLGLIQGFIIHRLSLLILTRLRFQVPKPTSIYLYCPPKWTGYAALLLFFGYTGTMAKPLENLALNNTIQTLGMCGGFFLIAFGFMGIFFYVHIYKSMSKGLALLICFAAYSLFAFVLILIGFVYVSTDYHKRFLTQK